MKLGYYALVRNRAATTTAAAASTQTQNDLGFCVIAFNVHYIPEYVAVAFS